MPRIFEKLHGIVGGPLSIDDEGDKFFATDDQNRRNETMSDPSSVTTLPFLNFDGVAKVLRAIGMAMPEESNDIKARAEDWAAGARQKHVGFVCDRAELDAALAKTQLKPTDKINLKTALHAMGMLAA